MASPHGPDRREASECTPGEHYAAPFGAKRPNAHPVSASDPT
jgi:hypothetical protein